ncbi:MAG TPA: ParB/RepB/Spo0J family partition protein [Ktedonosporobacter sp.]|nr:ParB/RepB/Spo0J family partition protein [Ktedonosporobacter sp.]
MLQCHLCQSKTPPIYPNMYIVEDDERGKVSEQGYAICYSCRYARSDVLDPVAREKYLESRASLPREQQPRLIQINLLYDNPYQPRDNMEEEQLRQLAEAIESQGFQGMLMARPHPEKEGAYQLTAGHRRREAARIAGLMKLPVSVRELSDREMAGLAATENLQREDLTPLEEGRLFQVMMDELGLTQAEIAVEIKKARNYVRNRLRLVQAPADIQALVASKSNGLSVVTHLLDIEDEQERAAVMERLRQKRMTTEDLVAYMEERKRGVSVIEPGLQEARSALVAVLQQKIASEMVDQEAGNRVSEEGMEGEGKEGEVQTNGEVSSKSSRLKTILRSLKNYRRRCIGQGGLSEEERELVGQILRFVQELAA